ncbi:MAG: tail fiber protein [Actinomycetota bacterium]|nr:tail fiber protein [Actinomycetota bacterium]
MSEPFLAEIAIFGFNFAPRGWAQCDGQILPINQNQSLYSLLGTTYGGDGRTSFALPDLRGRAPIHVGQSAGGTSHSLGQVTGQESVALTEAQIPQHTHQTMGSSTEGDVPVPGGNVLAESPAQMYGDAQNLTPLRTGTLATSGSGSPHNNMQPYQALNFCIALQGLFPSRN